MAVIYSGSYTTPRADLGQAFLEYAYDPESAFIGTKVFGLFDVKRKAGTFSKLERESLLRKDAVKRAPKSAYDRGDFRPVDQSYECVERGHEIALDHGEREYYANDFDAELQSSKIAMWRVMLDQEVDIASAVFDGTTNFTTANGLRTDVTTTWATATTDILADVFSAKEKVRGRTGHDPDTFIIGAVDLKNLLNNEGVRDALKYTQQANYQSVLSALGSLFGLEKVYIGKGVYNSAKEGQTFSGTDIWGTGWAMVAKTAAPGAPLYEPCMGRTPMWVSDTPESVMVEEYEESQTRSTIYRARSFCDELMIDTSFAQLLDTAA